MGVGSVVETVSELVERQHVARVIVGFTINLGLSSIPGRRNHIDKPLRSGTAKSLGYRKYEQANSTKLTLGQIYIT